MCVNVRGEGGGGKEASVFNEKMQSFCVNVFTILCASCTRMCLGVCVCVCVYREMG